MHKNSCSDAHHIEAASLTDPGCEHSTMSKYKVLSGMYIQATFCFPSASLYLGVVFWPCSIFFTVIYRYFRQKILCSFPHYLHALEIRRIAPGFLFLYAFVIALSSMKKDFNTYFPEQAGSETCYRNPEDILCFTLEHKS